MRAKIFSQFVVAALLLSACNLPFFGSTPPPDNDLTPATSAPIESATLPPVPVDLIGSEPAPGTAVRWYDGSTLVYVPSGKFLMGHGESDNPEHEVFLNGFWIYRTKVTNEMYARCVAAGKCSPPGTDASLPNYTDPALKDRPVVGVTWEQAEKYCRWLDARLPTEAEWEKTARGPNGKIYPWGDAEPTCNLANFANCVGHLSDVFDYPDGRSEYDAFDLTGNAFEWVADWYDPMRYVQSPPSENPTGPETGSVRSVRGSAYVSTADQLRPSIRYFYEPEKFRPDLGFRCVVEDVLNYAPPCTLTPSMGEPFPGGETSGGGTPPEWGCDPPPLNVSVATYCVKKTPYANVDLHGAINVDLGGASCSTSGDLLVCTGSDNQTFHMSACTTCIPTNTPGEATPYCPPGYSYDDAACACVYAGSPGGGIECPPSLAEFSSEQQCCLWSPSVPDVFERPFCDPGYTLDGCMCVSESMEETLRLIFCDNFTVSLPDCSLEHSCTGCSCYTTMKECASHPEQNCWWDPKTNRCKP